MKIILAILFLPFLCAAQNEVFLTASPLATVGAYGGHLAVVAQQGANAQNLYGSFGIDVISAKEGRVFYPLTVDLQYMPSEWRVRPILLCGFGYQFYPSASYAQAGVGINIKEVLHLTASYRLGFADYMQVEGWTFTITKPFGLNR